MRGNNNPIGNIIGLVIMGIFLLNFGSFLGGLGWLFGMVILFSLASNLLRLFSSTGSTSPIPQARQSRRTSAQGRRFAAAYDVDEDDDDHVSSQSRHVVPQQVAKQATQRAGATGSWLLTLEDIGVLAYHGDSSPDVNRLNPVTAETSHIRPFIVIQLPYKQGEGTIRFELIDETGAVRFNTAEKYLLKQGMNFVTPRTYLPLPTDRGRGTWSVRVSIGDRLLAIHDFPMQAARKASSTESLLADDGEIAPWLAEAIAENNRRGSGVSLDELLSVQDDDELAAASGSLR
ncbi:MAG: hypothetical protein OHK0023_11920 [Anaerolineae bacterium]